jgi:Zn-dependent metalloprotease
MWFVPPATSREKDFISFPKKCAGFSMRAIIRGGLLFALLVVGGAAIFGFSSCRRHARTGTFDEIAQPMDSPGWITFKDSARVNPKTLFTDHADLFQLPAGNEMRVTSEQVDDLGMTHFRFQQLYKGVEVENAEFRVHAKANVAVTANGKLEYQFAPSVTQPAVTEEQALAVLLQRMPDVRFYHEDDFVEDVKREPGETPYRPKGQLLFTELPDSSERVLAWMFRAYTAPIDRSRQVYVDATSGAFVKESPLVPSCFTGNGVTTFRGSQKINTSKTEIPNAGQNFILADDCHGNDNVLSMVRSVQVNGTRDVFDADNNWLAGDMAAVMSFYGLGISYDYFDLQHGRKSWTGTNRNMAIVNDPKEPNARGGSGVIWCRSGATANPRDDYNSVDIIGHEFTHSVVESSAKLGNDASKESSALNESFSDIFGTLIERWDEKNVNPEWIIGDDKGCAGGKICRDLLNPKNFGDPDTYQGMNWMSAPTIPDPHVNGSVQNRWFALLTDGGKGTNFELGAAYDIQKLDINRTSKIAYRTLTVYLTANSTYLDARNGSIQATRDLFGVNSVEENQVIKAWCAVGLCPFKMPSKADMFDTPGGNPNPASPNNNNTIAGATPLGNGDVIATVGGVSAFSWSHEAHPQLKVSALNIFPTNDVDYYRIRFPQVDAALAQCTKPGFAFHLGREVNARVIINGAVRTTFKQVSDFTITLNETNVDDFVLEVTAPFPGQLVEYNLAISFFLGFDPSCLPSNPQAKWDQVRECVMCNRGLLSGVNEVILDPDYRQLTGVAAKDHYFFWSGEGQLNIPITVVQGNGLKVDLVDGAGKTLTSVARDSATNVLSLKKTEMPAGVYSLRFSDFGNGTKVDVKAPAAP